MLNAYQYFSLLYFGINSFAYFFAQSGETDQSLNLNQR